MRAGYCLSGVLIIRIFWGLVGSHHARFRHFIYSPKTISQYAIGLATGKNKLYSGHNPVGAIMVFLLIIGLSVQFASGLFTSDDILWNGPFYNSAPESVTSLAINTHHALELWLKVLVIIHIIAVFYHQLRFREPLIQSMVHGYKASEISQKDISPSGKTAPARKWLLTVALIVVVTWVIWLWQLPI